MGGLHNNILNNRGYEFYLKDELIFWENLKEKFDSYDFSKLKLKGLS